MWLTDGLKALNEADSLRAENVLLWQLVEDAAAIISEQQDVIDHQTKLLMVSLSPNLPNVYQAVKVSVVEQDGD